MDAIEECLEHRRKLISCELLIGSRYLVNNVPAPEEAGSWSSEKWIDFINGIGKDSQHDRTVMSVS